MLKPNNEICLKCECQLKLKTISKEKMLQLIKSSEVNEVTLEVTLELRSQ